MHESFNKSTSIKPRFIVLKILARIRWPIFREISGPADKLLVHGWLLENSLASKRVWRIKTIYPTMQKTIWPKIHDSI